MVMFKVLTNHSGQAVSLSATGELVWWVVVHHKGTRVSADDVEVDISPHAGATPWSKVLISKAHSTVVTLQNRYKYNAPIFISSILVSH